MVRRSPRDARLPTRLSSRPKQAYRFSTPLAGSPWQRCWRCPMDSSARTETQALDRAPRMRDTFLDLYPPCIGEEEIAAVVATLRSGWITTGPKGRQFEQ